MILLLDVADQGGQVKSVDRSWEEQSQEEQQSGTRI
jgi:membrane protein implicated in regulation of membrane protease activity